MSLIFISYRDRAPEASKPTLDAVRKQSGAVPVPTHRQQCGCAHRLHGLPRRAEQDLRRQDPRRLSRES